MRGQVLGAARRARGVPQTALEAAAASLTPGGSVEITSSQHLNTADVSGTVPWAATAYPGASTMLDWINTMPWHPTRKRSYICGGRQTGFSESQKVVRYDEAADAWRGFPDPWAGQTIGGHVYQSHTLAPEHDRFFYFPYGSISNIQQWDTATDTFLGLGASIAPPVPEVGRGSWSTVSAIVWMPTLGAQGSIVCINANGAQMRRFDWQSQAWSVLKAWTAWLQDDHPIAIYLPGADIVLCGAASGSPLDGLYRVSSAGAVTTTAACPHGISVEGSAPRGPILPHPAHGNSAILLGQTSQRIYEYVAATDTWHDRAALNSPLTVTLSAACSLPHLGVVMIVERQTHNSGNFRCFLWKPGF
jgi:hypothetical protein